MAECSDCLYHKNCQFLLKHKTADVKGCTAFEDCSDWLHLPFKPGDTVYFVTDRDGNWKDYRVVETTVTKVGVRKTGLFFQMSFNKSYETSGSAIGKTVFCKLEEAERVLREWRKELSQCM